LENELVEGQAVESMRRTGASDDRRKGGGAGPPHRYPKEKAWNF